MALKVHVKVHTKHGAQVEAKTDIIEEISVPVHPVILKLEQDSVAKENIKIEIEKPFACSLCTKLFSYKRPLEKHMRRHTDAERYTCTVCDKRFSHKGNLKAHMRSHSGEKPFSCTFCNKLFSQIGDMKTHNRSHTGEKPFSCSFCSQSFGHRLSLRRHIVRHTGDTPKDRKSFPYRGTVSSAVVAQGLGTTVIIDNSAAGPETVDLHEDEEDIAAHTEMPMDEQNSGSKLKIPGIAVHAENIRISEAALKEANTEHEPSIGESDAILCRTTEKPYSCSLCKKFFSKNYRLTYHMRTHTKEKPFACTLCTKQFSVQTSLSRHMRCHTGEKPFSCVVCQKLFSRNSYVKSHMRIHTGEKPFSCSQCNTSFASQWGFRKHVRKHISTITYSVSPKEATKEESYSVSNKESTEEESYSVSNRESTEEESYSVSNKESTEEDSYSGSNKESTEEESDSVSNKESTNNERDSVSPDEQCHVPRCEDMVAEAEAESIEKSDKKAEYSNCSFEITKKPYACILCTKSFKHDDSLKVPMRRHTGEKPFS